METVLQEVVDSARDLTGARYEAIASRAFRLRGWSTTSASRETLSRTPTAESAGDSSALGTRRWPECWTTARSA